ncbi:hypothetical protein TRV_04008 [Trichophyton verrucosum HKI 0517]|uniref:Uncharacterized protein n=1 Tax=Trichophyton verrucosum (strain HKI 0517) TaxID=663202 RepID=D4DA64_TRIVH|nr:uncharacterized protein TRV_04008 [Trichophyton verrucosum HKI 0517]EFE41215.1 hypothetical protein TRV_04008 [Trichophyton verrucosum HKI 0517]
MVVFLVVEFRVVVLVLRLLAVVVEFDSGMDAALGGLFSFGPEDMLTTRLMTLEVKLQAEAATGRGKKLAVENSEPIRQGLSCVRREEEDNDERRKTKSGECQMLKKRKKRERERKTRKKKTRKFKYKEEEAKKSPKEAKQKKGQKKKRKRKKKRKMVGNVT